MKTVFFAFVLTSLCSAIQAQSLATQHVGSSGANLEAGTGGITFHIGEMVVQDMGSLRPGVIQYIDFSSLVRPDYQSENISIFPNPTHGPVRVQHELPDGCEWKVVDAQGRIVAVSSSNAPSFDLDLSSMNSGQYYLVPMVSHQAYTAVPIQLID